MAAQSNAPVIIKRKKIITGGGHHGGAWKVAMFHSFGQTVHFCAVDHVVPDAGLCGSSF